MSYIAQVFCPVSWLVVLLCLADTLVTIFHWHILDAFDSDSTRSYLYITIRYYVGVQ